MSRRIATLGVALVATLAVVALGGASGASAATLCNVPASPCPPGNVVPAPFVIDGRSNGPVTFALGPMTLSCATSGFTDQILNNPGAPILDNIVNWTFGTCVLQPGNVPCTVVAIPNPPPLNWPTRISTPPTNPLANGDFAVDSFGVTVTCKGSAPCTLIAPGNAWTITGDWFNPNVLSPPKPVPSTHAQVGFNAGLLGFGGFPCAGGATFGAAYDITLPPFPGPDLWLV